MKVDRTNLRIVLVDDDEHDRDLLRAALIKARFTQPLTHFPNGAIALDYFKTIHSESSTVPHIVLIDINMPLVDGVKTLHRLREVSFLRDLPVIILTGSDNDPAKRRRLAQLGIFRFLKKQPNGANVISALDDFIGLYNYEVAVRKVQSVDVYRGIFDNAIEGIFQTLPCGQYLNVNPALAKMYGYNSAEELVDRLTRIDNQLYVNPLRRAAFVQAMELNDVVRGFESEVYRKDGSIIWISENARAVRDTDGNVDYFEGMVEDITERKRAEEQIAEQAALLDIATDGIMVCDLESKILFWNKAAEHIYGWTRDEALGKSCIDLLYSEENRPKQAQILQAVLDHSTWEGEVHHLTKDKKKLVIESHRTLVRSREGLPKSVLIINTDITEKKKIEGQFMRAQRMESIGTLAGGIAHDLNNVLAPILMAVGILKLSAVDKETHATIDAVEASAKRGADIVRQVLSFARGVEGERTEIQLKALFKEIDRVIRDTFPKNIEFHISIPHNLWTVMGDSTQLHQVLLNLCVNARDAMPAGGHLTIAAENRFLDEHEAAINRQARSGPYVILSVTDTGTGIPPEILDKIFDPFFTTKESGKGTGLGLSTTMGIVKSHVGFLTVGTDPGIGSTFRVHLPANTSFEASTRKTQPVGLPRGDGETILIVDDDTSILSVTRQALLAFGYKVRTATNGAQAVGCFKKHQEEIALVITDMVMPIMDGLSTINALKKIKPDLKIIATTGLYDDSSMTRAAAAGIKYYLNKPCSTGTLLKTLQEALDAPVIMNPVQL